MRTAAGYKQSVGGYIWCQSTWAVILVSLQRDMKQKLKEKKNPNIKKKKNSSG